MHMPWTAAMVGFGRSRHRRVLATFSSHDRRWSPSHPRRPRSSLPIGQFLGGAEIVSGREVGPGSPTDDDHPDPVIVLDGAVEGPIEVIEQQPGLGVAVSWGRLRVTVATRPSSR